MLAIYNTLILQLPIGTPNPDDNQPLDFTDPFEVIVIIIMPILAFLFYILWRKKRKNKK
ncbi:adenylosuccinate synthetase [Polaribacter sp. ALD11]|uniref:adenylosuccinate synthetase n=1 Tax=Polaribacter sp. ALD11 TaxID=2058137 RepID=UPI000C30AE6F|nr:adenylosuccinate synthetase [Polaribacter sp. ALD11]AUC84320.1 adenylosuccinate synthetase [Polaribacter sp. ALD11]